MNPPPDDFVEREPPLTARSVVLSTLLGTSPPELSIARLIQIGGLFGLSEGTVRTAVVRMVRRREVIAVGDARYQLAGELLHRRERQVQSQQAHTIDWDGSWAMALLRPEQRTQPQRRRLRADLTALRLAALRDGVYLRPDNLPTDQLVETRRRLDHQCTWFRSQPGGDAAELAESLWSLPEWIDRATSIRRAMAPLERALVAGETRSLGPGFVVSAAALRHFQADPLLPRELRPRRWNGDRLRADYHAFDSAYRELLSSWWRSMS